MNGWKGGVRTCRNALRFGEKYRVVHRRQGNLSVKDVVMADRPVVPAREITDVVSRLVQQANRELPPDIQSALAAAREREGTARAQAILDILAENLRVARTTGLPICQDTGIDVVFVEFGQGVHVDGDLVGAINAGVAEATRAGFLRSSVCDPLTRRNTGDNTPAVVLTELVPGDTLTLSVLPKGCGSENMSGLVMLPPSAGEEGVVRTVVECVRTAGPNPCPPGVIGVGIGGTMEKAALLAKKALLRPTGEPHPRADVGALEERLLAVVNALGVGPLGFGGAVTALGVAVEVAPCHIASLPVAVNIQCHAARHRTARWQHGQWEEATESPLTFMPEIREFQTDTAIRLDLPPSREALARLRAGDWVLLSGRVYTGRDQTHRRLAEYVAEGKRLPVDLKGELIYYVGPSPAPPGAVIGSAGPTTSYRMDAYTPRLLAEGVLAIMGKGRRSKEVREALKDHGAVYLATIGGAGAYLAQHITACELVAFPELGPEALYRMEVRDFPAIVINDVEGADYYEQVSLRNEGH